MALLTVQALEKSYGVAPILRDVGFFVEENDKIGIIGVNGSGKTTLLRLLAGELEPDSGQVICAPDLRMGYLSQNVHITSRKSLYDTCKDAYARAFALEKELRLLEKEMETAAADAHHLEQVMTRYHVVTERFEAEGGLAYRSEIRGMLKGMGFSEERFAQPVASLSGGEKTRLELAVMLLGRPQLLLLDEPTNHLDAASVDFLEGYLRAFRGAALLVSHDRYFLNRLVNRVFLVEHHRLEHYDCGYAAYTVRRHKDLEARRRAYENQQKEIARQQEIIDRLARQGGSLRKRGISQSRSRQKLLDKMVRLEAPPAEEGNMRLRFTPKYESGEQVLRVRDLTFSYDKEAAPLFQGVNFSIRRGECVALVGANGIGKTTLFRLLLKKLLPDTGSVQTGVSVKTAWFDQEQEQLHDEKTVLDELWDAYPRLTHYEVRRYLAAFQFVGDDLFQIVGELSGGERGRLSMLKLMLSAANFLLLDEPTNHLDIESREILEDALNQYEGTCLVISHDRYFINRTCQRILFLQADGVREYLGNYDDFLAKREQECAEQAGVAPAETQTRTAQKKREKAQRVVRRASRALRVQARQAEKEVERLEQELEVRKQAAYDPALYEDHEKARAVHDEIAALEESLEKCEEQWLSLQLQVEGEEK